MAFPYVKPGDKFRPSAQLSNAVRRHLNEANGFRSGAIQVKSSQIIRVPIINTTESAFFAGQAVSLKLDGAIKNDCYPAVAYSDSYPCYGVALTAIPAGGIGDCALSGLASVYITGETTDGNFVEPTQSGEFARSTSGIPIVNVSGGISAVVMLGNITSEGGGATYESGAGINSVLLAGGTISTNLVQGRNVHIEPVSGSTTGALAISADSGGATGILSSVDGGTASITLAGGAGEVNLIGEGTVQLKSNARRYATPEEIEDWGRRYNPSTGEMDGDWKNAGWRGIITLENGDVMTEYGMSSEIEIEGVEVEVGYPLIVPDTTDEELETIAEAIIEEDDSLITQDIIDKAIDWAEYRLSLGKSPFYNGDAEDEQYRNVDDAIIISGQTSGGGGGTNVFFPDYAEEPYPANSTLSAGTPYDVNNDMWLIGDAGLDGTVTGEDYVELHIITINGSLVRSITLFHLSTYYESLPSRRLLVPVCMPISQGERFEIFERGNVTSHLRLYYC